MWLDCENSGGGGGGNVTIEYVGEFSASSGASTATTVNLKTGTYARSDYADLTADNFLVIPKRGSSNLTGETPDRYKVNNSTYLAATGVVGYKTHEYTASTGTFKFYGGVTVNSCSASSLSGTLTVKTTKNIAVSWKVYVVKPGISTFES